MSRFVLRRLLIVPFLLLGIVTISFGISRFISSDPLANIVGERQLNNPEVVNAAKKKRGLDGGLAKQYTTYMGNLFHGDLGTSFRTRQPVTTDLGNRLPATFELALGALIIGGGGGLALGALAASRKDKPTDHIARLFSLLGSSLPVFWIGLVLLFILYARLGWVPGPGRLPPRVAPPPDHTGFYTIDALWAGDVKLFFSCLARLALPCFVLGWPTWAPYPGWCAPPCSTNCMPTMSVRREQRDYVSPGCYVATYCATLGCPHSPSWGIP